MKTIICDLLGIDLPIIQGGMAWVADAALACAVSNAGGLGLISAANADADYVRGQIQIAKQQTDRPFGVNIMLMSPHADEIAQLVIDEGVGIVTTGAGLPSKYMQAWTDAGLKVIPVVPSVAIAKRCEKLGATAVVAEGGEAGGHIGDLSTMALTPQVVDAVSIPVIAAGGIADGRGLAAALMLGAQGVQMGTRFLVAEECNVSDEFKRRVLKAKDTDTIVTGRRLGHPVRQLKNPFSRDYAKLEYDMSISDEELEAKGAGALRRAVVEGDAKQGCFLAGQIAGMVGRVQTCKEMMDEMMAETEDALCKAAQLLK